MNSDKVLVTGHTGLVGSSLVNYLKEIGYKNVLTIRKDHCNLLDQQKVNKLFEHTNFESVVMCAGKVGGIKYNIEHPAEMIYENSLMTLNVLNAARLSGVKNLIFLGSSCIYPKDIEVPITEDMLLSGPFEETNESYAVAKCMGVKTVQAFNKQYGLNWKVVHPCNLFGPRDCFDLDRCHFMPAIIKRTCDAKKNNENKIVFWGNGKVKRELLYVDDLSTAIEILLRTKTDYEVFNVGRGLDYTIKGYYKIVKEIVGYDGKSFWNALRPMGVQRKLLDSNRIRNLGWSPIVSISEGIERTIKYYQSYKNGKASL